MTDSARVPIASALRGVDTVLGGLDRVSATVVLASLALADNSPAPLHADDLALSNAL